MGFDAHAKTFLISKDGGYIAAGNGLSCECENGKSVGFIFRADVCQGKISLTLTRPIGLPPHTPVAHKIADQR